MGPGLWFFMHKSAYNIQNREDTIKCLNIIKDIVNNLTCRECRKHAQEYLKSNKPEDYLRCKTQSGLSGLFVWTVIFHNTVNKKLGYPLMDLSTAEILYSKETSCENTCDASKYF